MSPAQRIPDFDQFHRNQVLESNAGHFRDKKDLLFLSQLPEAFEGATCGEVEDRYINVLEYLHQRFPPSTENVLRPAIISSHQILAVGKAGPDFYTLEDAFQKAHIVSQNGNEVFVSIPLLELFQNAQVFDQNNKPLEPQTVLAKNPRNLLTGNVFEWVQTNTGSWQSPIVVGVQNGLILDTGKLRVVEGKKNRTSGAYEWHFKRPSFDTGKYEQLSELKQMIAQNSFLTS